MLAPLILNKGSHLRPNTHTTYQASHRQHSILNSSCLQNTSHRKDRDCNNNGVLSRELVCKVACEKSTNQCTQLEHSSHEAFPETRSRSLGGHTGEAPKELIYDQRNGDDALVVSKEQAPKGRE
jgi:hypothetical protein